MKKLKAKATRRTAKKASMEKKVKSTWKENNVSCMQVCLPLWHLDKHCQVGVVLFKLGMLAGDNDEPG